MLVWAMEASKDCLVIGAGLAGLIMSHLLIKRGHKVTLVEAHSLPGGCSSYFKRGPFTFDVGATTLAGALEGRPFFNFLKEAELNPKTEVCDPGISIHGLGKTLRLGRNLDKIVKQIEENFEGLISEELDKEWKSFQQINTKGFSLLQYLENFPPKKISDLLSYRKLPLKTAMGLTPALFTSLESHLHQSHRENAKYQRFLNELLLISTQSSCREVSLLAGSMGLIYPMETSYPLGGMGGLCQFLLENFLERGGTFYPSTKVEKFYRNQRGWQVKGTKDFHSTPNLVFSTLPIWNLVSLLDHPPLERTIKNYIDRFPWSWGAITFYAGIKFLKAPLGHYHQLHTREKMPLSGSESLFLSISKESERAKEGWWSMTLSCHCDPGLFSSDSSTYQKEKKLLEDWILKEVDYFFPFSDVKFPTLGTPKTFEKFTSRFEGRVGGLVHSIKKPPFLWPSGRTSDPSFFLLGDTTFPGQGVPGISASCLSLYSNLKKERII